MKDIIAATQQNPANTVEKASVGKGRISMSIPTLTLSVPDIPGYHLHWMRGDPGRIAQALRAGYEYVQEDEVNLNSRDLAGNQEETGNSDLGTRVSVLAGGATDNQAGRLYLMKLREEFWREDQAQVAERNESVARALRGGDDLEANPHGTDNKYIPEAHKKQVQNMFTRKH